MKSTALSAAKLLLAVAALVFAVAWLSGGCEERVPPGRVERPAPPASGEVVSVVEKTMPTFESASGTVASEIETRVSSKILARIDAIEVRAGSVVEAGQIVIRLDRRELQARAREADEQLAGAQARFELARTEQARLEELARAGVASTQELDRVRSEYRVAHADLDAAQQRLRETEVAVTHAEIRSPVTGRVIDRLAEPGDTAVPGTPLLRIYDPEALRLEVPVRESIAVTLAKDQSLTTHIDSLDLELEGTVDEIVPFAEPGARTLLVRVRLPHDARLVAGMFGRVDLPAGEQARLLVPPAAVSRVGQLEFVTALDDAGRPERRMVTTGKTGPGGLEVLSGLGAGERVAIAGAKGGPPP